MKKKSLVSLLGICLLAFVSGSSFVPEAAGVCITCPPVEELQLTCDPGNDYSPKWSPDGSKIAFVSDREGAERLYVMNSDGSGQERVTTWEPLEEGMFDWINNNEILLSEDLTGRWSIYRVDLTSGTPILVVDDPSQTDRTPRWSPTANKLAYVWQPGGWAKVRAVNLDGSGIIDIDTNSHAEGPNWSNDGTRLAYDYFPGSSTTTIYTIKPDGTDRTAVWTFSGKYPGNDCAWSPDDQYILASLQTRAWNYGPPVTAAIYRIKADGSEAIALTDETYRNHIGKLVGVNTNGNDVWSPDGSRIVFSSDKDGDFEIYLMDNDGNNVQQLTNNSGMDDEASWSPDGSKILYASDKYENWDIYVVEVEGCTTYVDASNTSGIEDGSAANPYNTIQEGIDAAAPGCKVIVRDGTYIGTGNKNLDFGGKAITVRSKNGAATTIIDCEGDGRGLTFHSGETCDSVLDSFTITNGYNVDRGGAIHCDNGSSPTIQNCILTDNHANQGDGGGFWLGNGSSPHIRNCIISNNTGISGGGGGMLCYRNSNPIIENCMIVGNTAPNANPNPIAPGIYGNLGGGIYVDGSHVTIRSSILWNNSAAIAGDQIAVLTIQGPSSVSISYSDVEGGLLGIFNSGGTVNWGTGNIDEDPLFTNLTGDDYHLDVCSPAIDAGDPASDFSNEPAPNGDRINMGAYGNTSEAAISLDDTDGDGLRDVCDPCPNDPLNDADGDGVCGDVDQCPDEDATGLDADQDGCIDSLSGLAEIVQTLVIEGVIDEQMENSLLSKIENAENSADKENICAAVNKMEALKSQVDAQRGKKISPEGADFVIAYADNVIAELLAQLPLGESC